MADRPDCHRKGCDKPAQWRVGFTMPVQRAIGGNSSVPIVSWLSVVLCHEHKRSVKVIGDVFTLDMMSSINTKRIKKGKAPLDFSTSEIQYRKLSDEPPPKEKPDGN